MKNLNLCFTLVIMLFSLSSIKAQGVAINTTGNKPDTSAMLDISSSSKGVLFPRLTTAERNAIALPAVGLIILNSDCESLQMYTSTGWKSISSDVIPDDAGSISGTSTVCATQSGVAYSVAAIAGASTYVWNYTGSGFSIATGSGTNSITADFSSATAGDITVYGSNNCGDGNVSPVYSVSVTPAPSLPAEGTHTPSQTQIIWDWNSVAGATGYKWNTVNDYGTATDMGSSTDKTETGLTCNTPYTRYVWAYNVCGYSSVTVLSETTESCCSGDGTGGTITHVGGRTIHTFTSSGTFRPSCAGNVRVLVVAGGGGGASGGGGAGGFIYDTSYAVTVQDYSVTVGNGGIGQKACTDSGGNGQNSVFDALVAIGGGGGGLWAHKGRAGGSGGGAGSGVPLSNGGAGTVGQGNNGGNTTNGNLYYPASGGGGAGAVGGNIIDIQHAGHGGAGLSCDISGATVWYAGGGGGGINNWQTPGSGGIGGGGAGCSPEPCTGVSGTPNTGGGGGGADGSGGPPGPGGNGGSGIVIISYITP